MATYDIKALLENPEATATALHTICLRQYGEEWYTWDPSTVYLELREDFSAEPTSEVMDKLSAIQVVVSSDIFFTDVPAFSSVCSTLSDGNPLFNIFAPPSLEEIAWSVAEISLNRELLPFSRSIKGFIRALGKEYGFSDHDMPTALREVLEASGKKDGVQEQMEESLSAVLNGEGIENFMRDNLLQLKSQIQTIPEIAPLFRGIMEDGVIPTVHKEARFADS